MCKFKIHPETVRVVGPFDTKDEALHWAGCMTHDYSAWHYYADEMQPPTKVTASNPRN